MHLTSPRIRVDVGATAVAPAAVPAVPLAVLAVVDEDAIAGAIARGARAVRTLRDGEGARVAHLRLTSPVQADALPSLARGSRLADAARVAFLAGAPAIDLLAVDGGPSRRPEGVVSDEALAAFAELLDVLPEAVVVVPDVGRSELGEAGRAAEADGLRRVVARLGPAMRERFQVLVLDLPAWRADLEVDVLTACLGEDVVLARWTGRAESLAAHGWRSAAAALGGALTASPDTGAGAVVAGAVRRADPADPIVGRSIRLPPGRAPGRDRRELLLRRPRPPLALSGDPERLALLELDRRDATARVLSDPTFRRPIGAWSLSALRSTKAIHRALRETAAAFVFRSATDPEASALAIELARALDPWVARGMLVGPQQQDEPRVAAEVERNPGQWGLSATIEASLRPWNRQIAMRVLLRPQAGPITTEAAS